MENTVVAIAQTLTVLATPGWRPAFDHQTSKGLDGHTAALVFTVLQRQRQAGSQGSWTLPNLAPLVRSTLYWETLFNIIKSQLVKNTENHHLWVLSPLINPQHNPTAEAQRASWEPSKSQSTRAECVLQDSIFYRGQGSCTQEIPTTWLPKQQMMCRWMEKF